MACGQRALASTPTTIDPQERLAPGGSPRIAVAAVGAGLLALYLPVLQHGIEVWSSDAELSFGFLVLPIVFAILFHRRALMRASASSGAWLGLVSLIVGLLLLLAGGRTHIHALSGASLLPTLLGATAYLYGVASARIIALPTVLLTFSLSLYRGLLDQPGFTLQEWTARGSAQLGHLVGVPVRLSGVDLFVGREHFVVAQACSGMDSLLALLCLGVLFVGLSAGSLPRRAVLLGLVLPVILVANVIRVTLVLVLSRWFGSVVSTGAGHEALDAILFVSVALLFYLVGLSLRCAPRFGATRSSSR